MITSTRLILRCHSMSFVFDKLAPIKTSRVKQTGHDVKNWISADALAAKRNRRKLERRWKRTGDVRDRIEYRSACRQANRLIRESRRKFFEDRIHASSDSKQRWSTIKQLLHPRGSQSTCRNNNGTAHFSEILSSYFVDKIKSIKNEISKKLAGLVPDPFAWDVVFHGEKLVDLNPVSPTEVLRLLSFLAGQDITVGRHTDFSLEELH